MKAARQTEQLLEITCFSLREGRDWPDRVLPQILSGGLSQQDGPFLFMGCEALQDTKEEANV